MRLYCLVRIVGGFDVAARSTSKWAPVMFSQRISASFLDEGFDAFNPENVAPLVGYLASPEAGNISGEVLVVWGGEITVLQRPTLGATFNSSNGGKWELDDMHASLSEYFSADHMPVWGGFSVPPG